MSTPFVLRTFHPTGGKCLAYINPVTSELLCYTVQSLSRPNSSPGFGRGGRGQIMRKYFYLIPDLISTPFVLRTFPPVGGKYLACINPVASELLYYAVQSLSRPKSSPGFGRGGRGQIIRKYFYLIPVTDKCPLCPSDVSPNRGKIPGLYKPGYFRAFMLYCSKYHQAKLLSRFWERRERADYTKVFLFNSGT